MTMTMMRAGRYTVTDAGQLVGRITGDFVIGFRAELPDGSVLPDMYTDPNTAAEALKAGQGRPCPRMATTRLPARCA